MGETEPDRPDVPATPHVKDEILFARIDIVLAEYDAERRALDARLALEGIHNEAEKREREINGS